jgi:hypothetical protein
MAAYGWAKPPNGRVRHYYETGGTRPLCGKRLPHIIGERDPEASRRPHVDCARCTVLTGGVPR